MSRKNRRTLPSSGTANAFAPQKDGYSDIRVLAGVIACFFLSGFAALIYQIAWMRQFSVVFGTSELAVATVLSAYMAGLGVGAAVAARLVDRVTRPVLTYGLLEAGIALSALSVPFLLGLSRLLYTAVLGGHPQPADASGLGQPLFYLVVAFVVLAIPTSFMGATLPMLTKYVVRSDLDIGPRVGLLYATNTVGAVGGTIAAGFVLLPRFGLSATVWIGVAINALVFVIAAAIARSAYTFTQEHGSPASTLPNSTAETIIQRSARAIMPGAIWILPIMLLSGANSFLYEVLWTRLLGHILGGSIVAFATMLASFLSGIAAGSAIAARFAKDRKTAIVGFIITQCGVAVTSILIYSSLHLLIPDSAGLRGNVLLAIGILLPATLFIGATFPLAVRILAIDKTEAAPSAARVYSWNTFGAIAGATIAAFVLIPMVRYEGAIKLAVAINVFLGLAASLLLSGRQRYRAAATTAAGLVAILLFYGPAIPEEILRTSPLGNETQGDIRYYEVGRSATVLVLEEDGFFNLRTNGLPEASTNLEGAPPYLHSQRLLSTLPVIARPDLKEMLIVGFGAGVAVEGVPPSVAEIDVIELEPKVIEANRSIGPERQTDPLLDERVHVYINDARSALALTSKRYDAIVSQPSHPWTAGASHLYTREFMALAREHLNSGGVYLQWMNIQFLTESLFRSLCATIIDVYPYARIYQLDAGDLFFLGSDEPLDIERRMSITGEPLRSDPVSYLEKGIGSVEDLIIALIMDERTIRDFAAGAPILTDDLNRMATESAVASERGDTLTIADLMDLSLPYVPYLQPDSWVYTDFPAELEFTYMSERLESKGFKRNAVELSNVLELLRKPSYLTVVGMGLQRQGEREEAQRVLLQAIRNNPTDNQAKFALLRQWLTRLRQDSTPEYVTQVAESLTGSAAATLAAWEAAARQDWQELVRLDSELSRARPTDQWYREVVKLRVDWRLKVTTPSYQPRLAQEALILLDTAIAILQDPDLYSMRVAAAYIADDAAAVIETVRRLTYIFNNEVDNAIDGTIDVSVASIDFKLRQIQSVRTVIDGVQQQHEIPRYKTEQLDRSLLSIIRRLESLREQKSG